MVDIRIVDFIFKCMSKYNIIAEKSYAFAIRIVKLYKFLQEEKREFTLSKQVLRAGTSIGANVEEARGAQSDKDFLSKISISYKECRETEYWLRLLKDTDFLKESHFESIHSDCVELLKILSSIIISTKKKLGID